jgi:hypothetical protein
MYKITIEKIENPSAEKYPPKLEIYTQVLVHDNFDIKRVIDAFNQGENIGCADSIK